MMTPAVCATTEIQSVVHAACRKKPENKKCQKISQRNTGCLLVNCAAIFPYYTFVSQKRQQTEKGKRGAGPEDCFLVLLLSFPSLWLLFRRWPARGGRS